MRSRLLLVLLIAAVSAYPQSGPKIVVDGPPQVANELKSVAPNARIVAASGPELMKEMADAEILFGAARPDVVKAAPNLKWVQTQSAGVEYADFDDLIRRNIVLTNCKIIQGPEIADHAMALLLAMTRNLHIAFRAQANEQWLRGKIDHPFIELNEKTGVVIGLGCIGTQIAQRAAGFGMTVYGVDPKDIPMMSFVKGVYPPDRIDEILPKADVVFMSAPLTPQTKGVISEARFQSMKKGSYFVAVSRGGTYDNYALARLLASGHIAGAGVDVTEVEPLPEGHPLWKAPNIIITPHIAGQSDLIGRRRLTIYKENLRRYLAREPMLHIVDKQKRY